MKQTILFTALGVLALGASAQEIGRVISSTPVVQQVAVPRQSCNNLVTAPPQTSGGGGVLGAVVGGLIGNQIGHGGGRAVATGVGAVVGAIAGNGIEANNQRAQMVPTCTTEMGYENRTVGYDVTYEYAGRQFTTQMGNDPGPTVQLNVSPMGQGQQYSQAPQYQQAPQYAQPQQYQGAPVVVQQAPAPVVYSQYPAAYPAYPVYAPYPYYRPYAPVGVSLGFVFGGGGYGHGHGRWR